MAAEGQRRAKCDQCGTPAFYSIAGLPLCVDCAYKHNEMQNQEFIRNAALLNFTLQQSAVVAGDYGLYPIPQIKMPQPTLQVNPTTFNNINVSNSVVGAINTGYIRNLDTAVHRTGLRPRPIRRASRRFRSPGR